MSSKRQQQQQKQYQNEDDEEQEEEEIPEQLNQYQDNEYENEEQINEELDQIDQEIQKQEGDKQEQTIQNLKRQLELKDFQIKNYQLQISYLKKYANANNHQQDLPNSNFTQSQNHNFSNYIGSEAKSQKYQNNQDWNRNQQRETVDKINEQSPLWIVKHENSTLKNQRKEFENSPQNKRNNNFQSYNSPAMKNNSINTQNNNTQQKIKSQSKYGGYELEYYKCPTPPQQQHTYSRHSYEQQINKKHVQ